MSKPSFSGERVILAIILLAYLALGTLYAALTPPWQVPDEPAHYNYVRHLVEEGRLPELRMGDYDQAYLDEIRDHKFALTYSIDPIRYEFHQPPLYYLALVPLYALTSGALLPLRLFSVLLGAGVLVVAYLVGREVLQRDQTWLALGSTAFIAFIPQHIAMTAAVENDVMAELVLGIVLLGLVRWLKSEGPWSRGQLVRLGLFIGLGLWTKVSVYIALPLALIAVCLKFWVRLPSGRRRLDLRAAAAAAVALLGPALLLGLPWFVRNAIVYGDLDIIGLGRHDQVVVGQLRTSEWVLRNGWASLPGHFVRTTFHSFWAQFGWMAVPIDGRIYTALSLLSGAVALGFLFMLLDMWDDRRALSAESVLLTCSGLLTLATYLWYNLGFYQAQGRYLFMALIPLSLAWTLGLREVLDRNNARLVGIALALVTAVVGLRLITRTCGDKWRVLIDGLGAAFFGARWLLPGRLLAWFMIAPYLLLALLCVVSPFRFIIPYLTP
jgi:4-amino-4-deoxy-L-arabinose transferase-like glycosyltransferase